MIETWDAREVLAALDAYEAGKPLADAFAAARFRRVDTFSTSAAAGSSSTVPRRGTSCTARTGWSSTRRSTARGLLAVAYYDRGTRFVARRRRRCR